MWPIDLLSGCLDKKFSCFRASSGIVYERAIPMAPDNPPKIPGIPLTLWTHHVS